MKNSSHMEKQGEKQKAGMCAIYRFTGAAFIADTDTLSALTNMHPELDVGKPDFSPEAKLAWALIA
ncbi:uncharacterized protein FFUJ_06733 [Fusarium fujikuroi IMI 58289]|uniref:Uncharacterized protein n=1 Tax=Gibberella fujikuroi (strain CBS 195.34 / IMI 58289 / NRRL A-6831) TaxID=1279085 RepID=S0E2W5_GIBF5|nr:uncharacterized protein FFUJ_06733 [Fusarium fujikuroi IMI 58289]KLP09603.1 uncharacterized protein Y057_13592 [Fusarium fujikuroi]CCT67982.1 uncharacterized protein FFUJ_06733 [Fusarium fujikuroi IMI 58289]SCN76296.1 uncharacterized protein FFC1_02251 [Fusarium fujikuroi]SCN87495.1 uncharacterized protein FFE2_06456 [Fusarium fujikuroi]SCN94053.1 uncharacterized protein FFM5_05903 [Fusarium fujikuroi]